MENGVIKVEDLPPTWMNNAFLGTVLRSGEDDHSIMVLSSEINRATSTGDNYTSDMYRAVIQITRKGKNEQRSIIIKTTRSGLKSDVSKAILKPILFDQEINTFTLLHPEIYRVLDEAVIGPYQPFAAKYLYSNTEQPASVIVLEDLKTQGFRLAKPTSGLDFNHCLLVIRSIARYHAATVILQKIQPQIVKPFLQNLFLDEDVAVLLRNMGNLIKNCATEVETWPDYKSRFASKLNKLGENMEHSWVRYLKRDDSSSFNVITHGDLWMNNMMFRYNEDTGEVLGVRFVDFQLTHLTSPAIDLHYFLYSSASIEVLEKVEIMIEEYHDILCETLTKLGYQSLQPTLDQIKEELNKKGGFAVMCSTALRSVVLADRSKISEPSEFGGSENTLKLSEEFKISLRKLLPVHEERGWI